MVVVMLRLLRIVAIVVVIIILNNRTVVRSEPPPYCGSSSNYTMTCPGDHVEIRYPFWIENRTTDEIDAQECPQPRTNISFHLPRFLDSNGSSVNMTFFYNCSGYPEKVVQHVPCLYNSTRGPSFALLEYEVSTNQFDWYGSCDEAVTLSNWVLDYDYTGALNYTEALKSGFVLSWSYPVNCGNCELSGGKCWANQTNQLVTTTPLHCICPHNTYDYVDYICRGSYSDSYYGFDIEVTPPPPAGFAVTPSAGFAVTPHRGMTIRLKIIIGVSVGVGGLLLLLSLLIIFRRKCYPLCYSIVSKCRKKIRGPTNVEVFLDNNNGRRFSQRYKYSDIKKMTNWFKDTLGQGGYGSVFKGKLRDGRLVAVKVLNESKGKGEDFINEVTTIGRTNHVNVVSLLGFCAEGTKRALVYEFMPNGSLEKFIHNAKDSSTTSSFLGWEKLYQIALGIARGLEYLHRGCNTRILHFDIKPHNILLDKDFCPKIADFGLAKLCPTKESLVSMVGARGTIGYIAPEVCCRNFGGVSHKSDVYSYGMMVLEMIGGRKNIDATVENLSEIYFPQWIYRRLREDIKVEGSEKRKVVVCGEVFAEDVTQKMIIVALWCIQAPPGDRPSMTKVVEMLEGNREDLQFPPNPFPDPSSKPFPSSS